MTTRRDRKWRIIMGRQPEKALRRLPQKLGKRIDRAILSLADNPRPSGHKRLVNFENLYRIRVGRWRVIYTIRDEELVILIVRVAPRGSAYHNL